MWEFLDMNLGVKELLNLFYDFRCAALRNVDVLAASALVGGRQEQRRNNEKKKRKSFCLQVNMDSSKSKPTLVYAVRSTL